VPDASAHVPSGSSAMTRQIPRIKLPRLESHLGAAMPIVRTLGARPSSSAMIAR
jgi:hypothetical protein